MKQIFALGHLVVKNTSPPCCEDHTPDPPPKKTKKRLQTLHNVEQQDHDAAS